MNNSFIHVNIIPCKAANGGLTEITVPEEVQLDSFDTTSFIQTNSTVKVIVRSGSWMDQNFDNVFENGYIKEAN